MLGQLDRRERTWSGLEVYRVHENPARSFNLRIVCADGAYVLRGYCADDDGARYSEDDGCALDEDAITHLRALCLDDLPGEKRIPFRIHASDGVSEGLILSYGEKTVRKKLTEDVATKITRLLRDEIKNQKSNHKR